MRNCRAGAVGALLLSALLLCAGPGTALEVETAVNGATEPGEQQKSAGADGSGGGAGQLTETLQDDSVRCRLSGICELPSSACGPAVDAAGEQADPLACVTSDAERAAAVQEAMRHAWAGYKACAWGEDELAPLSCAGAHWLNLSLTMVDSLDTLYLLGMREEFEEAASWLSDNLNVGTAGEVNLFETTIRILGGLLSAQALSAESHPALSRQLAEKAAELGARLLPAFNSPSGVPYSDVNLRTGVGSMPAWAQISSLSEISSVSLEFTYLARITGHAAFESVPLAVHNALQKHGVNSGGLLGQYFNPLTGDAHQAYGHTITLGARSDSYYEYLFKQWLLTGRSEDWLRQRYVQAMQSVRGRLLKRTAPLGRPGLWYVGEQPKSGQISSKMDHLVCFLPGLLALSDYHGVSTVPEAAAAAAGQPAAEQADGQSGAAAAAAASSTGAQAEAGRGAAASAGNGNEQQAATAASVAESGQQDQPKPSEQQQTEAQQAEQQSAQQQTEQQAAQTQRPARPGLGEGQGTSMPDLQLASELALTCYELYRRTPAGLAPEIVHFQDNTVLPDFPNRHVHDVGHGDFQIKPHDAHNLLRPESVESFYLLWKVTGDPQYKQWAWQVFRALHKWAKVRPADRQRQCATCRAVAAHEAMQAAKRAADEAAAAAAAAEAATQQAAGGDDSGAAQRAAVSAAEAQAKAEAAAAAAAAARDQLGRGTAPSHCKTCSDVGGFSSLESVLEVPPRRRDKMESFFLAETLKYLYLIFSEPPDRCLHPSCAALGDSSSSGGGDVATSAEDMNRGSAGQHRTAAAGGGKAESDGRVRRRLLPLDRFVFTTEAHALPVVGPTAASRVSRVLQPESPLLQPFGQQAAPSSSSSSSSSQQPEQQQQQQATSASPAGGDGGGAAACAGSTTEAAERGQEGGAGAAAATSASTAAAADGTAAAAAAGSSPSAGSADAVEGATPAEQNSAAAASAAEDRAEL